MVGVFACWYFHKKKHKELCLNSLHKLCSKQSIFLSLWKSIPVKKGSLMLLLTLHTDQGERYFVVVNTASNQLVALAKLFQTIPLECTSLRRPLENVWKCLKAELHLSNTLLLTPDNVLQNLCKRSAFTKRLGIVFSSYR